MVADHEKALAQTGNNALGSKFKGATDYRLASYHHETSISAFPTVCALSICQFHSLTLHYVSYYEANDAYTFVPIGESASAQSLTIDRSSGLITLHREYTAHTSISCPLIATALNTSTPANARRSPKPVYGILGIISLSMCMLILGSISFFDIPLF